MTGYFLRRFLLIIPTFLGITLAVFVIMLVVDVSDASKAVEESLKLVTEALIVAGLFAALRDPALADPTEPGVYFRGL